MKIFNYLLITISSLLTSLMLYGQTPSLGTSANFVLFTSNGAVTNTGISQITGNVGTATGSTTGFGNVNGQMHDNDGTDGACATDLLITYNELDTAIPNFVISTTLGNNDTLIPGVYNVPAAATLGSNLILNANGNTNAVFIFQIQGSLSVAAMAKVKMINGGMACNVYWKVEGLVSIATGATMRGSIIAHNAAIAMSALDTLEGRALSINGAITVDGLQAYTPLGCSTPILTGPIAPNLRSTKYYGVFSTNGPVSNTGITHITGDVGTNVGLTTGFDPLLVTGSIHPIPDTSTSHCAADLTLVYNYLEGLAYDIQLLYPAQFGHNLVLTPHTYLLNAATALTDSLYLNAEGDDNAVFVIQINGALSTSTHARVILMNGTKAKNVYWKVDGAVTIADSTIFSGTIVANNAAILFNIGTLLNGRALSTTGAVTINGSTIIAYTVTDSGSITGDSVVCVNSSITLSNTTSSSPGTWSSNNIHATISTSGVVMGISAGIDTIEYTVIDTFGTAVASRIITINPRPSASVISGGNNVCMGSTLILTDSITGGTWTSSNSRATVLSGTVNPVAVGIDTISYIVNNSCGADTVTKIIIINPIPNAGFISGGNGVCLGTLLILSDITTGGTWSSNFHASVFSGTVNPISAGVDTIMYIINSLCGADTAKAIISINPLPNAGVITGYGSVCLGNDLVLNDTISGGTWSSSNANALVISGNVTPIAIGIDTIKYIVNNSCGADTATKIIAINTIPNAGNITGGNTVCIGSILLLNNVITGGVWISNVHASIVGGTVNPISIGTDTIKYIVSNACRSDTATAIVSINPLPNAGSITGGSLVCLGSSLILNNTILLGTWQSSNSNATVVSGTVNPISIGVDTIWYLVSNSCGTDTAKKIISISTIPNAGTISGATFVCIGSNLILNDVISGGTWTSNLHASIFGGNVTPLSTGTDTIQYIVNNTCGADTALKIIYIDPLPNAGFIIGADSVCMGNTLILGDFITGGTWVSSNANATIISDTITPVYSGVDTIWYIVSNICGSDTASKTIIIHTLPNPGLISGATYVCKSFTIILNDTISGGIWTAINTNASILDSLVTGNIVGVDTIYYTVTNTCGHTRATKIITINPLPDAGIIMGLSEVCVGAFIKVSDSVLGGAWSLSNSFASISNDTIRGINPGVDTIRYIDTNLCGTDFAQKAITINPLPYAGIILGGDSVCLGSSLILFNLTLGGIWSSSNSNSTIVAGTVYPLAAGKDTIKYLISNVCGMDSAVKVITINPLPNAGIITGLSSVCVNATITLSDTITTGVWSSSNFNATIINGNVTGVNHGQDTISYTVSNICGSAITQKAITINPIPSAGLISGIGSLCLGETTTISDTITGGSWISSNTVVTVTNGIITSNSVGFDTILYLVSNICGTDTSRKIIVVNALPAVPIMNTIASSSICSGTGFQNFGTSIAPISGTYYSWSTVNATISNISNNGQYALISFPNSGNATVILSSNVLLTNCKSRDSSIIDVSNSLAQQPTVLYFQYHFVCLPYNLSFYQWGYDDKLTLDSTLLPGEINQDYLNANPDFDHKFYWVMTGNLGCSQKTYLTAPTGIQNINIDAISMQIFPNPTSQSLNISINSINGGEETLEISSMTGQKLITYVTTNHQATLDVSNLAPGIYMVSCIRNGISLTTAKFVKTK